MSNIIGKHLKLFVEGSPPINGLLGQKPDISGTPATMIIGDELHGELAVTFIDRDFMQEMGKNCDEQYEADARDAYRRFTGVNDANEETRKMIAKAFGIPPEKLR